MPCTTQTVQEPAELSVTNISTDPSTTAPGETFTVTVRIENTGSVSGSGTFKITIDGSREYSDSVSVNAGGSVTRNVSMSISATGSHQVCAQMI